MSIAANIVSTVLKTLVSDRTAYGLSEKLVSVSLEEISEMGVNEITDFINRKRTEIDSILSRKNMGAMNIAEENIDYVAAEIRNLLSGMDITDEVFRKCRYDSARLADFMWDEYVKDKSGNMECESEIKKCMPAIAKALSEVMCESGDFGKKILIQISNSVDDANERIHMISNYLANSFDQLGNNDHAILEILEMILEQVRKSDIQNKSSDSGGEDTGIFKNNRKQTYLKNWNNRLFLHIDNDANPITLADAFIMPDYEMHKSLHRIGLLKEDSLGEIIEKFVNYDKTSAMLITGIPGIGKSSITSWIADKYKDNESVIFLRFRDWERDILENTLLDAASITLGCKKADLDNKVLILDGFDEMKALEIRDQLLDTLFIDLSDFENFKCIITSRTNYIDSSQFPNVLELKGFDMKRIEAFVKIITGRKLKKREGIESNIAILGIPVILYLSLMSGIDIGKKATKPELYQRIFAKKGGIFDRFCDGAVEYSAGRQILRDSKNANKYLDFLQKDVAFKMFETNDLSLGREEYKAPDLEFDRKTVSILDFPVKYLFENTDSRIEFIHKSIYEYFVAEYIFAEVKVGMDLSKEKLAGVLAGLFKKNMLSEEIIEFLRYRIKNDELKSAFYVMNEVFQLMQQNGMTYYMEEKNYKNIIQCEMMVFANMLEFLHMWAGKISLSNIDYVKYNTDLKLNLMKMDLSGDNLRGVDLRKSDLRKTDLKGTILGRADLRGADLRDAVLIGTNLRGADLRNANTEGTVFEKVDLRGSILDEVLVNRLKNKCNVRETNVCIKDIGKIVSYEDYLNRGRNVI